jgi:Uma2 family endonuclease
VGVENEPGIDLLDRIGAAMTIHVGQVPPQGLPDPIYRLSVAQYHELIDAGVLTSGEPVELLEGLLVQQMSKMPPHSTTRRRARRAIERAIPAGFFVDSQEPVTTGGSEPEPDVFVARGDESAYTTRHPGPADIVLVVEVADTTLVTDRGTKQRVYARAKFPTYSIVNLIDDTISLLIDGMQVGQIRADQVLS